MSFTVKSDLAQGLQALGAKREKIENLAVGKAVELVAEELEERTPKSKNSHEHAQNNVVYTQPKNGESSVGYDKKVAWRMRFLEFGTIKQAPKAIVQRTMREMEEAVIDLMAEVIREELGLS
ncbi:HK97-gp10 family putative phage morphogenesis protein [Enterococcus faecalis]|uniref:HK97-gp10 family putative phage morphogenesis protein n=1 Tax=Enterococcus faecalis TaxID=1351 RepID=UPI00032E5FC0|nr:HK97-gp10 family putative phage morphogenesis protein [Enterococcus faecalis]EOJ20328.1 HK97 gp10 family phage protein [Enterococcus faecalis EnGen0287]